MDPVIISRIAQETAISETSVSAAVALFEKGATGPFIVHYRKEATGELDEKRVRAIQERMAYYKELFDHRAALLGFLSEQGKLTNDLKSRIEGCFFKADLDDLHHQFRSRRKTPASEAIERGLEPLAEYFWHQESDAWSVEEHINVFVDSVKGISTAEQALQGVVDIIAEWICDNFDIRKALREMLWNEGFVISTVVPAKVGKKTKYNMYYERREAVAAIPSHRVLAIRRGCKEGILVSSIEGDNSKVLDFLLSSIIKDRESIFSPVLEAAAREAYSRILRPMIETEVRTQLKERADREAIKVFQENLSNLLLSPPAGPIVVMGVDWGKGDECNVAVINEGGMFLEGAKFRFSAAPKAVKEKARQNSNPVQNNQEASAEPVTAPKPVADTSTAESTPVSSQSENADTVDAPQALQSEHALPAEAARVETPQHENELHPAASIIETPELEDSLATEAPSIETPQTEDTPQSQDTTPAEAPSVETPQTEDTPQSQDTTPAEASSIESPQPEDTIAASAGSTASLQDDATPTALNFEPTETERTSIGTGQSLGLAEKAAEQATIVEESNAETKRFDSAPEGATLTEAQQIELLTASGMERSMPESGGSQSEAVSDGQAAGNVLRGLIAKHNVRAISIGAGPSARELETLLRQITKEQELKDIMIAPVNDAGVAIYSSSRIAREEFPDWSPSSRCAVSLARRLQDPLAELVKIDPKLIGVGQYQHDVDQKELHRGLLQTVQYCVNRVGVNANTATESLLRYVSGLNEKLARRIVAHRKNRGPIQSRSSIISAVGMDETTYEQSAAFLRIPDSDVVLDRTAVHPESYAVAEKMAASLGVGIEDLIGKRELIFSLKLEEFVTDTIGIPTLAHIQEELLKPGRDPRKAFRAPKFRADLKEMSDLRTGMTLQGTVTNVTNFGAFVDIGVRQDGLVHLSQMSNRFIRDPREAVKVGDVVQVKVISIEPETKRIGLSMKALLPAVQRRRRKQQRRGSRSPLSSPSSEGTPGEIAAGADPTAESAAGLRPKHNRRARGNSSRNRRRGARKAGNTASSQQVKDPASELPEPTLQEKIAILQSKFRRIN
jgi:transcriptional accessory protein Tex/SPT6